MLTQQLVGIVNNLHAGNLHAARDAVFPLLEVYHQDYRVWHLAGLVASQSGHQEQAEIYLKQTHQLAPKQVEPLINLAKVYALQNKLNLSASCFLKTLSIEPENISALYGFSKLLVNTQKYAKAIDYLTQWLAINKNIKAYQLLAKAYIGLGDFQSAELAYKQAINIQMNNTSLLLELADLYVLNKAYGKAIQTYIKILAIKDTLSTKLLLANSYYFDAQYDNAAMIYHEILASDPNNIEVLNNLSCVYKDMGKYKAAEQLLEKLIAQNITSTEIYANFANLQIKQKKYKLAETYYLKAIIDAKQPQLMMQSYAINLLKAGEYKKAWSWFTKGFSCLAQIKLDIPQWQKINKKDIPLLIIDGNIKDIILFSRFISIISKQVKILYVYHPDNIIRNWFQKYFPTVQCLTDLQSLPKDITHFSSFMALPELMNLTPKTIMRKDAYIAAGDLPAVKNKQLFLAIDVSLLATPTYLSWLAKLCEQYQVTIFTVQQLNLKHLDFAYFYTKDINELTNKINTFQVIISDDNTIVALAGALGKTNQVLSSISKDWSWLEKLSTSWYPLSSFIEVD